jgi:hypothetical protein
MLVGSMLAAGFGGLAAGIVAVEYGVLAAGTSVLQPAKTMLKARINEIWDIFG